MDLGKSCILGGQPAMKDAGAYRTDVELGLSTGSLRVKNVTEGLFKCNAAKVLVAPDGCCAYVLLKNLQHENDPIIRKLELSGSEISNNVVYSEVGFQLNDGVIDGSTIALCGLGSITSTEGSMIRILRIDSGGTLSLQSSLTFPTGSFYRIALNEKAGRVAVTGCSDFSIQKEGEFKTIRRGSRGYFLAEFELHGEKLSEISRRSLSCQKINEIGIFFDPIENAFKVSDFCSR